jgi:hypothetical protein
VAYPLSSVTLGLVPQIGWTNHLHIGAFEEMRIATAQPMNAETLLINGQKAKHISNPTG